MTMTLDPGHTGYCYRRVSLIDRYLHTRFCSNRIAFCGRTDKRMTLTLNDSI